MSEKQVFIHNHPSIIESASSSSVTRTYRWETLEKKNIFLYITVSLKKSESGSSYLFATTNLDSEDVRGQGGGVVEFFAKRTKSYFPKWYSKSPSSTASSSSYS